MNSRRCPRCQATWDSPARYCPRDGAPLVDLQPASPGATVPRRTQPDAPATPPALPPSLIGETIADRYKVRRRLGEGGMSHVYLADDLACRRECALKILTPRLAADTGSKQRLRREALLARRFNHPNVCPVRDVGETSTGQIFLVMPYLRGESLNDSESRRGPYPLDEGIEMLRQLANGLQHAHELGVVHRDLKPENVMLVPDPAVTGGIRAVVMDFGLAKALEAGAELVRLTQTGIILGTPEFMSPEQVYGRGVDGRSDVFSLGVLGFEMFTGELPFGGRNSQEMMLARLHGQAKSVRSVRSDLPARLDAVLTRALAAAPADRYPDMRAFAAALAEVGTNPGLLSRWLKR
jgi:eukaryotic-like serine/threonine-protein kinase